MSTEAPDRFEIVQVGPRRRYEIVNAEELFDKPFTLEAMTPDGSDLRTGPLALSAAIALIDSVVTPNGWFPRLLRRQPVYITDLDDAIKVFTVAPRGPVEGTELFRELRRAIAHDDENDDGDVDHGRAAALIAHLEAHRPLRMFTGDEECLRSECPQGQVVDGEKHVCNLEEAGTICVGCTPFYDHGGEWGLEFFTACSIPWPCTVLISAASHYKVPLPAPVEANPGG